MIAVHSQLEAALTHTHAQWAFPMGMPIDGSAERNGAMGRSQT